MYERLQISQTLSLEPSIAFHICLNIFAALFWAQLTDLWLRLCPETRATPTLTSAKWAVHIYYQYAKSEQCTILHIDFGVCILFMQNMPNNMQKNSALFRFCIFCILQYAQYAEYVICTICRICQIICCSMQNNMQNMPNNMQKNSALFRFCIFCILQYAKYAEYVK